MVGESESWLDPDCEAQDEPTEFTESMEITTLPPGEYLARLDGEHEARFVVPEEPSPTSTDGEARSPSSFIPLGRAECSPPSPFFPWPEDGTPGGLAEVRATASDIDVWGLFWATPPLPVDEEIKIVWRVTGMGEFDIRATQGTTEADLTFDPNPHQGSNFQRPGDEWGTAFVFPSPGCWEIQITRGADTAYVWVEVEARTAPITDLGGPSNLYQIRTYWSLPGLPIDSGEHRMRSFRGRAVCRAGANSDPPPTRP
jgi:hypothetical protein